MAPATSIVRPLAAALLAVGLSRMPAAEGAAAFYVSTAGDDAWSGTRAEPGGGDGPFATLARARDAVRTLKSAASPAGPIVVQLRGGRYELKQPVVFTPDDSGSAAAPIVYMAYPGERPLLSGGTVVSGWKAGADGRWTATVPGVKEGWYPRQLVIDGERRYRTRLPKEGFFRVAGFAGADPKGRYDIPADKFEFKDGDLRSGWTNPADIDITVLHFWVDTHLPVKSIDEQAHVVSLACRSRRRLTDDYNATGARYYVDNVYEALSAPGEWYLDRASGALTYLPRPGEDPAKAQAVLPVAPRLIELAGRPEAGQLVEHLSFKGLAFSDTLWSLPPTDAGDVQAANTVPGALLLVGARDCAVEGCSLVNLGTYGVEVGRGSHDCRFAGNEFAHLAGGGLKISGGDAKSGEKLRTGGMTIVDNHLHHLGELYHSSVGVLVMHASGNTIAHNHIHHLFYTGISVGWVWGYGPSVSRDNLIEANDIHDIGQKLLSDMGGIYMLGRQPGTVVRGNRIHDVDSWGYGGWGIYTDEGSSGIVIEGNLVYRTKSGGFHQHYGQDNVLRNNIFVDAREQQLQRTRMEDHLSFTFERNIVCWSGGGKLLGSNWKDDRYAMDYNCYWHAGGEPRFAEWSFADWQKRGKDVHSLIVDPHFTDPAHDDYSLAPDSPALKLGFAPLDLRGVGPRR
jgi:parallel beta-helix repeat protein